MISIIVPVYNVEPYLRKCLDSIVGQTYRDLEILVIDDGSTDCSGKICDEYAELDGRIKVFHTENRGLSAARNLGLNNAAGDYIGFVDSDDWVESDMYEVLMKKAEETGADIVECGFYIEYSNIVKKKKISKLKLNNIDAIHALLRGELSDAVWCKLWKKHLFKIIRFPEKRIFEEIATTYRLFALADTVCSANNFEYHYIRSKEGLSQTYDMRNLIGCWLSNKERYLSLNKILNLDSNRLLLKYCAFAVTRTWAHYNSCDINDRIVYYEIIKEMHDFTRVNIPLFGYPEWDVSLRLGVLFPHFFSRFSFNMAGLTYLVYKKFRLKES